MCFAPQRRALFRHLNFQTWSGPGVFCTFWLRNVLRATTACTFSSLIWPDGSAPAALASLLFDPPEPQIIGKTQCFAAFLPFRASASSFFWLFLFYHLLSSALLFSLPLPSSAFHLSILSEVWLLNFLRLCNFAGEPRQTPKPLQLLPSAKGWIWKRVKDIRSRSRNLSPRPSIVSSHKRRSWVFLQSQVSRSKLGCPSGLERQRWVSCLPPIPAICLFDLAHNSARSRSATAPLSRIKND